MKATRSRLVVVLLALLLAISLSANWFLFRQGRWYYVQLNTNRLDPLGLGVYLSQSRRERPPDVAETRVVFLGDSRAAGWPAPTVDEITFINRGIGGETSAQTALRFDHHIEPLHPQVVVLQTGINDLKVIPLLPEQRQEITDNCIAHIEQIVAKSKESGAVVIVTTLFPLGQVPFERRPFWSDAVQIALDEVNAHIRSIAGEGVYVFDSYAILVGDGNQIRSEYSTDLLHLNEAGYRQLNRAFVQFLSGIE